MRVLAVGNMYPPHHLGGYELVWRSAMRHLQARGWSTRVLTTDHHADGGGREDPGTYRELRWYWREHAWPKLGWKARIALERHNAEVLRRHLERFDPDVVSWWSMGGMSLSMIETVRRAGIPAVAFVHDDWLAYGPVVDRWTHFFAGRMRAELATVAERVTGVPAAVHFEQGIRFVFVSETVRSHARSKGYSVLDSTIAHSGIDARYLDPRPSHEWRWRLLCVGRLDERKGVDDAVSALLELPEAATVSVAGGGDAEQLERVRSLARRIGLAERVSLLGMRSRAELLSDYEAADVVIFPARWREPWGLVPLEAMALGRPVVSTAEGGPREYLVDQQNALVIEAEQPRAIAQAVHRLAGDPQLRARLREGGLKCAARHTETDFNRIVEQELAHAASRIRSRVS